MLISYITYLLFITSSYDWQRLEVARCTWGHCKCVDTHFHLWNFYAEFFSDFLRNEDMDGEWEAPRISNPACRIGCGEWTPPLIDNPKYKGVWRPPMIDNPNYQVKTTCSNSTVQLKMLWYFHYISVTDNVMLTFRNLICDSVY